MTHGLTMLDTMHVLALERPRRPCHTPFEI